MDDSSRYLEETFGGFFFSMFLAKGFVEVAPLELVVFLGGDSKTDTRGGRESSHPVVGTGAQCRAPCTRVRFQVLRPAGSPAPRLPNWRPFSPSLTQKEVAQQEAGTSLFCFVAFARSRRGWGAEAKRGRPSCREHREGPWSLHLRTRPSLTSGDP